jgi:hypothetical protein
VQFYMPQEPTERVAHEVASFKHADNPNASSGQADR